MVICSSYESLQGRGSQNLGPIVSTTTVHRIEASDHCSEDRVRECGLLSPANLSVDDRQFDRPLRRQQRKQLRFIVKDCTNYRAASVRTSPMPDRLRNQSQRWAFYLNHSQATKCRDRPRPKVDFAMKSPTKENTIRYGTKR